MAHFATQQERRLALPAAAKWLVFWLEVDAQSKTKVVEALVLTTQIRVGKVLPLQAHADFRGNLNAWGDEHAGQSAATQKCFIRSTRIIDEGVEICTAIVDSNADAKV